MDEKEKAMWHKEIHPRTPTEIAAQIWCDPRCSTKPLDGDLAAVIAERIDREQQHTTNWLESAHQFHENEQYYRGLVVKIGEMLGEEAYTQDDGGKVDEVLCAKVPDLVAKLIVTTPPVGED
jgi:hypothetical protein